MRSNTRPKFPHNLSLRRRVAWQILSKALDISSITAHVARNVFKSWATLSDIAVRITAVGREDLKPQRKSKKKKEAYYLQVFQRFHQLHKENQQGVDLVIDLSPTFFNTRTTVETIIWKTKFFQKHILKKIGFFKSFQVINFPST